MLLFKDFSCDTEFLRFVLLCRLEGGLAEKGAAAPEKDVKELKSEAKNVWKYLKPFKVTPSDGGLGPQERELIQGIVSGNIPLNAKPAADITAKWNTLER